MKARDHDSRVSIDPDNVVRDITLRNRSLTDCILSLKFTRPLQAHIVDDRPIA